MTTRRKLTTLDKLKIMVRQAVCPECGEKLGALDDCEFDHQHQLAMGGGDTLDNLFAKHVDCHKRKTARDAHARKKVRSAHRKKERFSPLPTGCEVAEPKKAEKERKPKRKIQSRGFRTDITRTIKGEVRPRT